MYTDKDCLFKQILNDNSGIGRETNDNIQRVFEYFIDWKERKIFTYLFFLNTFLSNGISIYAFLIKVRLHLQLTHATYSEFWKYRIYSGISRLGYKSKQTFSAKNLTEI